MPANVSLSERAIVTAGLANEVDAVNQYAATMYPATAYASCSGANRADIRIVINNPNVATNSLNHCGAPVRA